MIERKEKNNENNTRTHGVNKITNNENNKLDVTKRIEAKLYDY